MTRRRLGSRRGGGGQTGVIATLVLMVALLTVILVGQWQMSVGLSRLFEEASESPAPPTSTEPPGGVRIEAFEPTPSAVHGGDTIERPPSPAESAESEASDIDLGLPSTTGTLIDSTGRQ